MGFLRRLFSRSQSSEGQIGEVLKGAEEREAQRAGEWEATERQGLEEGWIDPQALALLKEGAERSARNQGPPEQQERLNDALLGAVRDWDLEAARQCVEAGGSFRESPGSDFTVWGWVFEMVFPDTEESDIISMLKLAFSSGVPVDESESQSRHYPMLNCAISATRPGVVRFLVEQGAEVTAETLGLAQDNLTGEYPVDADRREQARRILDFLSDLEQ